MDTRLHKDAASAQYQARGGKGRFAGGSVRAGGRIPSRSEIAAEMAARSKTPITRAMMEGLKRKDAPDAAKQEAMQKIANRLRGDEEFSKFAKDYIMMEVSPDHPSPMTVDDLDPSIDYVFGEDEVEEVAARLISRWSTTSGDNDKIAVAMQLAAKAEFGGGEDDHLGRREDAETLLEEHPGMEQGMRTFLRAQYDETQDFLEENGITEVTVFRGVGDVRMEGLADAAYLVGTDEMSLQPMSSFSIDVDKAFKFAHRVNGSMLASTIPAESILSTPRTGYGSLGEAEVVVLAGPHQAVYFAWSSLTKAVSAISGEQSTSSLLAQDNKDAWLTAIESNLEG